MAQAANAPPVFDDGADVTRSLAETTGAPAEPSARDVGDGDTLAYSLSGADAALYDIVSASGQIPTKVGKGPVAKFGLLGELSVRAAARGQGMSDIKGRLVNDN